VGIIDIDHSMSGMKVAPAADTPQSPNPAVENAMSPPHPSTSPAKFSPMKRLLKRSESQRSKERKVQLLKKINRGNLLASKFESMETRMFKVGRMLVESQITDHRQLESFKFVCHGQLNALEELINSWPKDSREHMLKKTDGAGATIIHIAYLYQNFEIGRYLVKNFPELSTLRYTEKVDDVRMMPYLGENILHIAIAHRAYDEVKWLLDFHRQEEQRHDLLIQLLSARTLGHFFQPHFTRIGVYFGEYPIHFAVCSNDLDILDLLVECDPNALFFVDSHGNNALHLCVLHELERMFDYVIIHAENIIRGRLQDSLGEAPPEKVKHLLYTQLIHIFNNESLTPFTLAAKSGKSTMFRHMLKLRTTRLWSYGPVDCSVVDLVNLDTVKDKTPEPDNLLHSSFAECDVSAKTKENVTQYFLSYPPLPEDIMYESCLGLQRAHEEKQFLKLGAIEWICRMNHLDMLDIPEVSEIISKKWERFGFPTFFASSLFGLIRTILITLIICLFAYSEGDSAVDWAVWCLYPLTWLLMFFGYYNDAKQISLHGLNHWGRNGTIRGAALLENICSTVEFALFTAVCVSKFVLWKNNLDGDAPVRVTIALTALTSWIRIYYILMGFKATGNFVVIVSNILMKDIPLFFFVYITILFGFGSAHAVLTIMTEDRTVAGGFESFFASIWGIFRYTVDGQNLDIFDDSGMSINILWIHQILSVLYNVCIVLLMLNLLIAMMSETYSDLVNKSHLILARERYNMMCSYEIGMSDVAIQDAMKTYAIFDPDNPEVVPTFEMQTMNPDWQSQGSAATTDFDNKMKNAHIDMPAELRYQASEGEVSSLKQRLLESPELLNSRDPVKFFIY